VVARHSRGACGAHVPSTQPRAKDQEVTGLETGHWPSLAPKKRPAPAFSWSHARGWSVASWSLALGSKQATKRPKGGFLEPGWGLATQPNKPIVTQYRATDLMHTSDMQGLFFRTKLFSFSMHCMLNQEMSKPCIAIH
jgi:hypothetical protein